MKMENQKSLTLNGLTPLNFLYLCLSIAMIFVGAYLTNHFFDTLYPQGITGGSTLCNINDFWGCDKATLSPLGVIAGMPTSVFGIIMGVIGIITAFAGKREFGGGARAPKPLHLIISIKMVGCHQKDLRAH